MRRIFKLITLQIILLILVSCGSANFYQSAYQSEPFNPDQVNKEWIGGTFTSPYQAMVYGMTNDENNLYMKLKIVDSRVQRKILLNGLTLWFDTDGKSKKKLGYAFPLINEKARMETSMPGMDGSDKGLQTKLQEIQLKTEDVNKRFQKGDGAINVVSEEGEIKETIASHRNEKGINIMLYMDEFHILYYEARIPINKVFGESYASLKEELPAFSYGFEIGELELGVVKQSYMRQPSMMRSGSSQVNRGMYSPAGMRQPSQMYGVMKTRMKAIEVWVKQVKLSTK
jgi:hypothetical protein